ncbi:hypothetical protein HYQ44_004428 [Verticillium longisporum]|nr:hypothetical protein HYQ44_004428 [Verticillium longisporum]
MRQNGTPGLLLFNNLRLWFAEKNGLPRAMKRIAIGYQLARGGGPYPGMAFRGWAFGATEGLSNNSTWC